MMFNSEDNNLNSNQFSRPNKLLRGISPQFRVQDLLDQQQQISYSCSKIEEVRQVGPAFMMNYE